MDVLKPKLVWIEDRCYRKLNIEDTATYIEDDMYPTQPNEYNTNNDDDEEETPLPIKYENQKFWISLPVPGPLIGYVCGKHSNNIKRIEDSTGGHIKIPSRLNGGDGRSRYKASNEKSSDFVITADKRTSVSEAYRRLQEIMITGRWRVADFTHFISIPVNSDSIQEKFLKFRKEVLTSCKSARGIKEAMFTNPHKLHLTIVMLTLLDEREKEQAKAALNECRSEIMKMLEGKRLLMKGIEYMNDDDAEVDVLYGRVVETDGSNVLQIIAEKLAETFSEMNLAPKDYSVKLHVTLLKSRGDQDARNSFDARPLLQKFGDYLFGELDLTEIHISTRHSGPDKYYTPSAVISLKHQ